MNIDVENFITIGVFCITVLGFYANQRTYFTAQERRITNLETMLGNTVSKVNRNESLIDSFHGNSLAIAKLTEKVDGQGEDIKEIRKDLKELIYKNKKEV